MAQDADHAPRATFVLTLLAGTLPAGPAALAPDTATAQTGPGTAEAAPVVVESTRIPTELDKTGASVTVITEDEIEKAQDRQVTDTLRRVPGLSVVQSGAFGAEASVSIRGAAGENTLVLIDGVEVNNPSRASGDFNFGGLDASNIERIEVLRGPQSTLYGSDAIGGVISITTKSGREGFAANAFLEGGSFETVRGSGTVRGGTERARASLTVSGTDSAGISLRADNDEEDGFSNVTVAAKGAVDLSESLTLDASVNVAQQTQELDVGSVPRGDVGDVERVNGRIQATHSALDGRLTNRVAVKALRISRENVDETGARTLDARGAQTTVEYQGTLDVNAWLTVTAGAENQDLDARNQFYTQGLRTTSGYGLARITPIDRLSLTAGVRHDAHSDFENATTGRVSASYRLLATGTTLRGAWGQGFNAPTAFQLVGRSAFGAFGNPDLKPEESESWEIGLDQGFLDGRVDARVTYFNQDISDKIVFQGGFFSGQYQNVAETEQQGVETSLSARLADWATLQASYTYLDAVNVTEDDQIDRLPRHRGSTTLQLAPSDRLDVSGTLNYRGSSEDGDTTLAEAFILDVRGSYTVTEHAEVFGRVENLLDEDYQVADGFRQPGIAGFAGVRVSF